MTASFYYYGFNNNKRDTKKALNYYTKAIRTWENPLAQFMVGMMYIEGEFLKKDEKNGTKWIILAANRGWSDAQAWLGYNYQYKLNKLTDDNESEAWYLKAFESKKTKNNSPLILCTDLQLQLDKLQETPELIHSHDVLNMGYFRTPSKLALAYISSESEKSRKDQLKKTFWYSVSGTGNLYHHFQAYLGTLYFVGVSGFEKKNDRALECFKEAADIGDNKAMYCLGCFYEPTEKIEAFKWFSKSKEYGNTESLLKMAEAYYHGRGTEINYKESISLFETYLRCQNIYNNGSIYNMIGQMYANGGYGIRQNYTMAMKQFNLAAELSFKKGFTNLGLMYAKGYGVKKDHKKAYEYYKKGAEKKCGVAKVLLEIMQKSI